MNELNELLAAGPIIAGVIAYLVLFALATIGGGARRLAWVAIDRRTKHSVVRRLFALSRHRLQGEQLSAA
jgi:hypothetical protein